MKVIGLCGGSGSGKGTVSRLFLEHNIPSIDTDAVYREMINGDSPCLRALRREFGDEILSADGSLDRRRLASIVFCGENSVDRLKRLNDITHRFILDETRNRLSSLSMAGYKAALVDAPVLFESGFDKECDLTLCVVADRETRISRIIDRDAISRDAAEQRINSQISSDELISRCDLAITNNKGLDELGAEVTRVAEIILENNFER